MPSPTDPTKGQPGAAPQGGQAPSGETTDSGTKTTPKGKSGRSRSLEGNPEAAKYRTKAQEASAKLAEAEAKLAAFEAEQAAAAERAAAAEQAAAAERAAAAEQKRLEEQGEWQKLAEQNAERAAAAEAARAAAAESFAAALKRQHVNAHLLAAGVQDETRRAVLAAGILAQAGSTLTVGDDHTVSGDLSQWITAVAPPPPTAPVETTQTPTATSPVLGLLGQQLPQGSSPPPESEDARAFAARKAREHGLVS